MKNIYLSNNEEDKAMIFIFKFDKFCLFLFLYLQHKSSSPRERPQYLS